MERLPPKQACYWLENRREMSSDPFLDNFRVADNTSRTLSRAALVLAKGLSRVDPQDSRAGN
jgi:hypothetical protein